MQSVLVEDFSKAIHAAFPDLRESKVEVAQSTHGDYQCNSAMKLTKELRMAPRAIAEAIIEKLDSPLVESTEIAGPGFINVTLKKEYLEERVNALLSDPRLGVPLVEKPLRIICEFSSPNTAKEMHVGHLRSTIIGDSIAHLLEFLGHDVVRLNHVGNWGTQFGMLIAYIQEEGLSYEASLSDLMAWYKASKQRFDHEPAFKKRAQQRVVALQGGDPDALEAWERICEISRRAYQEIYDLLDVKLIERGESTYNSVLPAIVKELEPLIQISEGAKCIFLDGFVNRDGDPLPLMIQKSDGGYGYATTDMAAIKQRIFEERADWLIYVIDAGQSTHMRQVFAAAQKAGWLDPEKVRADHVTFGLVLGPDGKKFRTRSGETIRLIDLLNEAIAKAKAIVEKRAPKMSDEIARAVGLGAVKYADLSCQRTGDYQFSYDRMLRFEGNTAAFMLYAYVRTAGIKRKVKGAEGGPITIEHPSERALVLHLLRFPEALDSMAKDLMPHRLCDYLFKLAELFNAFFRDCRVEGSDQQASRLSLCETTAKILKHGLSILGVKSVDRM